MAEAVVPTRRATLAGFLLAVLYGPEAFASTTTWKPISGATGQHYIPKIGDKRHRLRCKVIAHNSAVSIAMHTHQTNAVKGT